MSFLEKKDDSEEYERKKKMIRNMEKQMHRWVECYYSKIYKFVWNLCGNRETAEHAAESTFELAYQSMRKLCRMDEAQRFSWMIHTARYYVVKEIYEYWEQGENLEVRYHLAGEIDPEQCRKILEEYEKKV